MADRRTKDAAIAAVRAGAWIAASSLLGLLLVAVAIRGPGGLGAAHWLVGAFALGLLRAACRARCVRVAAADRRRLRRD